MPAPQWRGIVVLLRVLGLASGVCLALGPEFPEVAHRGPHLIWSGGHIPIRGAPYICRFVLLCVFACYLSIVLPENLILR